MSSSKILIIDDDRDIVDAMETILTLENFTVSHAYNGSEGVKRVKEYHPDIIFLDYMLPDTTGKDIALALKRDDEVKKTPIILVSAAKDIQEIAKQIPVDDVLEKPFDMEELITMVYTDLT